MIITVGAEKGGVAKSRIATHIATLAAQAGVDVMLLDTDQQGSSTSWCNLRNEEGVEPGIPVVSIRSNPAREIVNLSSRYALIVIDIGAQNYKTMLECAIVSDLVIVPCGNDQQEMESTLNVFKTLDAMGPRHKTGNIPAHVLLTRVSATENAKSISELKDFFRGCGVNVFDSYTAHRAAWLNTGKTGRALHELKGKDRSPKAIAEMQAVYDEILVKLSSVESAGA